MMDLLLVLVKLLLKLARIFLILKLTLKIGFLIFQLEKKNKLRKKEEGDDDDDDDDDDS